jgi:chemotaxis protein CheC
VIVPSEYHLDVLRELINMGVGRAAASLNDLLQSQIELEVPSVSMFRPEDFSEGKKDISEATLSCVQLGFHGSFTGTAALVFPPQSAAKLVATLVGEDPTAPSLDAVMAGTLNEVGNIVINGVMGTIGNILRKPFDFSLPNYLEGRLTDLLRLHEIVEGVTILLVRTHFRVEDRHIEGSMFLIFELGTLDALLKTIDELRPL